MATYSSDARAALLATYLTQWMNPQAGMRYTRATPYAPRAGADAARPGKVSGPFGARGRTIYNADAHPLAGTKQGDEQDQCGTLGELGRIDVEEARRRHWDQFLMAARGDTEEEEPTSRETTPPGGGTAAEMTAEDVFVLYVENGC